MNETTKAIKLGELLDFLNTLEESDRARAREFKGGSDELYRHYDSRAAAYRAVARWANGSALPLNETTTRENRFAQILGENTELRQEVQQLEAYVANLKKRLNLNEWNLSQVSEQLDEACKRTEYWRGRALAAESELAQIKSRLDCNGLADVAALPFGD